MFKPSQHPIIHSRPTKFYLSSRTNLFILLSVHSCHFYQTFETLKIDKFVFNSPLLLQLVFAPNTVGAITPRYKYFFSFKPNTLGSITQHTPQCSPLQYSSFILCSTSSSHLPSTATCGPKYLKQFTSSNGSRSSLTLNRAKFSYRGHLITLFLLTSTCNWIRSLSLPNSPVYTTSLVNYSLYSPV